MTVRRVVYGLLALAVLLGLAALAVVALNLRGEQPIADAPAAFNATPAQLERGRYLALAGNCAGCHTARGAAASPRSSRTSSSPYSAATPFVAS